jgi:hypothetical protein
MFDESRKLADDDRRDQQDHHDEPEHDQTDRRESRQRTADSAALQPRGQRIQHIGKRHRGHKWQQHFAQKPKHNGQDRERREPEHDMAIEGNPGDLADANSRWWRWSERGRLDRRRFGQRRLGQRLTSAELMWRTHSIT